MRRLLEEEVIFGREALASHSSDNRSEAGASRSSNTKAARLRRLLRWTYDRASRANATLGAEHMGRTYRIAVIPGDGIGKETTPEGVRVLEAAAKKYGFTLQQDWFDFSSCDYYAKHGRMLPEDWKEKNRHARRHLLRRGRLARQGARPRLAVGLAAAVPARVRPVRQPAPGQADAGRAVAARRPQARRHRLLRRAREHRGRIFLDRRAHVRRAPTANSWCRKR